MPGQITLNGRPYPMSASLPLLTLLAQLEIDRRLIAVAHNGEVIPRDRYEAVSIAEGDEVEVVRMVGGG